MYRQLIRAMRNTAVVFGFLGACVPFCSQAATVNVTLDVQNTWKGTGVKVGAGDPVTVQTQRILRFWDAMSFNSNGEWLYCPNWKAYLNPLKRTDGTYGESANRARTDSARPLPTAPSGALIFRIGNGKPFFVPSSGGTPGKDFTSQLGVMGYTKLPGYSSTVSHNFVSPAGGPLFVAINLSENAKSQKVPRSTTSMWNWPFYSLKIGGKQPTECRVSGKVVDEKGKELAEAVVQIGSEERFQAPTAHSCSFFPGTAITP